MLTNCRIVNIDQLLQVICGECHGTLIKLGNHRDTLQKKSLTPSGLPDHLTRQYQQAELKQQVYRTDLTFFCASCMEFTNCRQRYTLKLTVYHPLERALKELVMFDQPATDFFGCTAQDYLELTRKDETLKQRLEDYLTETTWNITLQKRKKVDSNLILSMTSVQSGTSPLSIIPFLVKKHTPSLSPNHHNSIVSSSPTLLLDPSLSLYF
ncbi:hypothetical protein BC941DRAFT_431954 [Chlamydoabsidia padenii]|nr:hypothetical protein BC941DRAFT_431954 [Chlamydoabsidia padenii]